MLCYVSVDLDGDGHICDLELHNLLKCAGHDVPGYMFREIMQKLDRNKDNKISFDEFLVVCKLSSHCEAQAASRLLLGAFSHCELVFVLSPA